MRKGGLLQLVTVKTEGTAGDLKTEGTACGKQPKKLRILVVVCPILAVFSIRARRKVH